MRRLFSTLIAVGLIVSCFCPAHGSAAEGTLKWIYSTGGGIYSSPAIGADGTIYVGSRDGRLYALTADGILKWSFETGDAIDASPSIAADGTIYVGSGDFRFYAINGDGTVKWSYPTGDRIRSSAAIGPDGAIYVGSGDYKLHAINPNGTFRWSFPTGRGIYSSPAIAFDGTIYVGSSDSKLYAVNPDGTGKWSYDTQSGMIYSSPAIGADGTIYVGALGNEFFAINPNGTGKWRYDTGGRIYGSPAIGADGTIAIGSGDRAFYLFTRNGVVKERLEATAGFASPPAVGANGIIYVGSLDGNLHAIDPATGQDTILFTTGGEIWSSPAIGPDGTVYVGSLDGSLYALYSSSFGPALSSWPLFRRDLRHTANIAPSVPTVNLIITKSGSGSGMIFSTPTGIECGTFCSTTYSRHARISLTALPDRGSLFTGWSGDCRGKGACAVTMSAERSVGAVFEKGSCSYTVTPRTRTLTYLGGSISAQITARGSAYCPIPGASKEEDWFTLGVTFLGNRGTARLTIPEYNGSTPRTGTATVGENTIIITQTGKPCTVTISPSVSDLFPKDGGTGFFDVTATPSDCTWVAGPADTSPWITVVSGNSGTGSGTVIYTVDANRDSNARTGSIKVMTFDKKSKSFTVKQDYSPMTLTSTRFLLRPSNSP